MPAASKAYDCTAAKDGQPVAEAKLPFTLAITLNEAAALVDKQADNLCAFVKSATAKGVWRRASITVNEAKTAITFKSPLFGTYMVAYCGDAALAGFAERTAQVDSTGGGDEPTDFPFACYQTPYKYCQYQRGDGTETGATAIAHCKGGDQQGVVSAQCPADKFVSSCNGPKLKGYYYTDSTATPPTECFDGETFSDEYSEG